VIARIQEIKPNYVITTLSGESNLRFYQALRLHAGIPSAQLPAIGCGITELEIQRIGAGLMAGDYAVWNYFQSIDTPANQAFRSLFRSRFGPDHATTDPIESAYVSVLLWARAVEKAGTPEAPAVRNALHGLTLDAPEGPVRVDQTLLQTWRRTRLGRIRTDGQFDLPIETEIKEPLIYPKSRTPETWHAFLQDLYQSWGNQWEAPDAG
jgi:urea transport system substrate-binding protein